MAEIIGEIVGTCIEAVATNVTVEVTSVGVASLENLRDPLVSDVTPESLVFRLPVAPSGG